MKINLFLLSLTTFILFNNSTAQTSKIIALENVLIYKDTAQYEWNLDKVLFNNSFHLPFEYQDETEILEVYTYFNEAIQDYDLDLIPSGDFEIIDSLLRIENYVRFKVKLRDITSLDRPKLSFLIKIDSNVSEIIDIPLLPFTKTYAEFYPINESLFVGEE